MKSVNGSLWKKVEQGWVINCRNAPVETQDNRVEQRHGNGLAFAGVYLFTLLLHARPNELFPSVLGTFPLAKIVVIVTALVYFGSRLIADSTVLGNSLELKMVALIAVLAILFMPVAASPQDSMNTLLDSFLKILVIFALMINLLDNRERLDSLLKLVLVCNFLLAVDAIGSFYGGEFQKGRIAGAVVGGIFGNPNDLATSLDTLLPISVALALTSRGLWRLGYLASAVTMATAVILTFSRGGLLGLVLPGGFLLWKLSRRNRLLPVAAALLCGGLLLAVPSGYGNRLLTIFNPEADKTGSAQERQKLLQRGVVLAAAHPVVGIGMGNFHIFSIRELRAHNSYVEIAAELGVAGLVAYVLLIVVPLHSLRRIERETFNTNLPTTNYIYCMALALQASLASYLITSTFGSYQYSWFLYYVVSYAIALRTIHNPKQMESVEPVCMSRSAGAIWSQFRKGSTQIAPLKTYRARGT